MKRIALIAAAAALPIVVVSIGLASQQGSLQLALDVETLSARAAADLDRQASQATRVPTTVSERPLVQLRHPAPVVREAVRPAPAPAERPATKVPAIPAPPTPPTPPKPARATAPVRRAPLPAPTPRLIPTPPALPAPPAPPTAKPPVRPDLAGQALEDARRVLRTMPAAPARDKAQEGRPGTSAHPPGARKPGGKGRLFVKPHGKPRGPGHRRPGHKQGRRPGDKRGKGLKPPRPPGLRPGKPPPPPPQPKPGVKPRPK
jgi:hypothetical protein